MIEICQNQAIIVWLLVAALLAAIAWKFAELQNRKKSKNEIEILQQTIVELESELNEIKARK